MSVNTFYGSRKLKSYFKPVCSVTSFKLNGHGRKGGNTLGLKMLIAVKLHHQIGQFRFVLLHSRALSNCVYLRYVEMFVDNLVASPRAFF